MFQQPYIGDFTTIMHPFNLSKIRTGTYTRCYFHLYLFDRYKLTAKLIANEQFPIKVQFLHPPRLPIGRIVPTGHFEQHISILPDHFIDFLRTYASAPLKTLRRSERNTGICCFCNWHKDDRHGAYCRFVLDGYPRVTAICLVPNCHRYAQERGYCHTHYDYFRRHGLLLPRYVNLDDL